MHLDTSELRVCGPLRRPSTTVRDLGVLLETDLSMRLHVAWTVGCCSSSVSPGAASSRCLLGLRRRLLPLLSLQGWTATTACSPARLLDGLQSVLNATARIICNRRKYDHVTPLLRNVLHWLPVPFRIEYKLCLLVFLSLHGAAPENMCDCCIGTHSSASGLRLRSLEKTDLRVRRMRTVRKKIVLSLPPVLDAETVSLLLFVLLTQWTHLKCSLKLTCSLRLTLFSCLLGPLVAVWPRYCAI